jgi:hypothetical protein
MTSASAIPRRSESEPRSVGHSPRPPTSAEEGYVRNYVSRRDAGTQGFGQIRSCFSLRLRVSARVGFGHHRRPNGARARTAEPENVPDTISSLSEISTRKQDFDKSRQRAKILLLLLCYWPKATKAGGLRAAPPTSIETRKTRLGSECEMRRSEPQRPRTNFLGPSGGGENTAREEESSNPKLVAQ